MPTSRPRTVEIPHTTTDLYEAAYLITRGITLKAMSADSRRVTFEFPASAREAAFDFPTSTVPTLQYVATIKSLKTACSARMGGTLP